MAARARTTPARRAAGRSHDADGPAPPGFQIQSKDANIPPSLEVTYCYHFETPNTETLPIHKWKAALPPGVHAMELFVGGSNEPAGDAHGRVPQQRRDEPGQSCRLGLCRPRGGVGAGLSERRRSRQAARHRTITSGDSRSTDETCRPWATTSPPPSPSSASASTWGASTFRGRPWRPNGALMQRTSTSRRRIVLRAEGVLRVEPPRSSRRYAEPGARSWCGPVARGLGRAVGASHDVHRRAGGARLSALEVRRARPGGSLLEKGTARRPGTSYT